MIFPGWAQESGSSSCAWSEARTCRVSSAKEVPKGSKKRAAHRESRPKRVKKPRSPGGEELPVRQAGQGHAQTVQILQGDVHPPVQGRTKVVPPSGEEVSRPSPRSGSRCLSDHAPRGFHHGRPREIGLLVRTQAELPRKDQLLPLLLGHRGGRESPSQLGRRRPSPPPGAPSSGPVKSLRGRGRRFRL